MSTYLLLRNNKESGPFTMDEIQRMSLKAYDLVWVEGKSAAWRYPGEITEFNSFAPQVPEQPFDRFYKKPASENVTVEIKTKTTESRDDLPETFSSGTGPGQGDMYEQPGTQHAREVGREAVYVNMPATEVKNNLPLPLPAVQKSIELKWEEPLRPAEIMTNTPVPARKTTGRGLLIASLILLFGAGLCTGFFISNRRNIYSTDVNPPHSNGITVMSKDFPQSTPDQSDSVSGNGAGKALENLPQIVSPAAGTVAVTKNKKKSVTPSQARKDSINAAALTPEPVRQVTDSSRIKQEAEEKKADLAGKIKLHPEDYLPITAGKLKTGVLGGISEFPITITNRAGINMDLVVVSIDYILHNKKVFKSENVSFQNLAAGATVTSEAPKSSRGVNISYRVSTANAQQIGLSYSN